MRRIPNIGSLDDCFDEAEDQEPRAQQRANRSQLNRAIAAAQSARQAEKPRSDAAPTPRPRTEDTVSLDGMTIDELLALSDTPPADADDSNVSKEDTGEWDAIEDMLDPNVMLREAGEKK